MNKSLLNHLIVWWMDKELQITANCFMIYSSAFAAHKLA